MGTYSIYYSLYLTEYSSFQSIDYYEEFNTHAFTVNISAQNTDCDVPYPLDAVPFTCPEPADQAVFGPPDLVPYLNYDNLQNMYADNT